MTEKSILAYFDSPDEAERALDSLKRQMSVVESEIVRFDGIPDSERQGTHNPYAGDYPGLASLTLGDNFDNPDASVLAAASTSASGLAGGPYERDNQLMGRNILLTVIVDNSDFDRALSIVKAAGALE